jgi:hypothetical protein
MSVIPADEPGGAGNAAPKPESWTRAVWHKGGKTPIGRPPRACCEDAPPLQYAPFLKTYWIAARRALAHVTGRLYKVYTNTPKSILFSYGQVSNFRSVTGVFKPHSQWLLGVAMNRTDRGANDGGSLGDLAVTQENTGDAVVTGSRLISSATGGARTRKPRRTAMSNPPQISRLTCSQTAPAICIRTS